MSCGDTFSCLDTLVSPQGTGWPVVFRRLFFYIVRPRAGRHTTHDLPEKYLKTTKPAGGGASAPPSRPAAHARIRWGRRHRSLLFSPCCSRRTAAFTWGASSYMIYLDMGTGGDTLVSRVGRDRGGAPAVSQGRTQLI